MAGTTPVVRGETLTLDAAEVGHTIFVGSSAWFAWLEGATSFAYRDPAGSFTARKEQQRRGGWYWKAYRKLAGKLHRTYLGKTDELTAERLAAAAATLAAFAEPEPGATRHVSDREAWRTVSTKRRSPADPLPSADERPVSFVPSLHPASAAAQHAAPPADWPRGTVTFLFTDIVDSTQLWERYPQAMPQVLVRHDALVHAAIATYAGVVFKTLGDAVCAAFARAPDALAAARAAQHALHAEDWTALGLPPGRPLHVRMALHTGAADAHNADYLGPPLNRVARILAAGHGGQILLSHATRELVGDTLPDGLALRDLGTYPLKGLSRPEQIFQLISPDLPTEFPPLMTQAPAADGAPTTLHPLLATKLAPPPPRADLTPRPRLVEWLRRVMEHQLTLVVAPPGFGKTTLLSAWLHRQRQEARDLSLVEESPSQASSLKPQAPGIAWLTLDDADNDPVRFWTYLIAALEQHWPGIGADAAALLRAPQPAPIETVLTVLVNAVAATPGQLVLVLDDYHLISAAPIQRALATLIAYLPPNFHLVIASRADVPLPLARLRARGQVAEIRVADLRCTPEEAAAFLRTMLGHDLAPDAIATLLERTEGWMAGLQLAALSLQGEEDATGQIASIRGENRYIWDYLVDEVLERQPPAVQQFLLHTALLDRMCAELCDAVFEASDTQFEPSKALPSPNREPYGSGPQASQHMLEALEAANLFVVPLDAERRWYRYHRLFADVLRLRLRQLHPELVTPLHRRAAAWYQRSGFTAEAIQHALVAQDWDVAAVSIEESAEALLMHGEVATLIGWARMLPPEALRRRPRLGLFFAAALTVVGQLDEAAVQVREAEQASDAERFVINDPQHDRVPEAGAAAPLPGELATIKAAVAAARDDFPVAISYAREALAQLPQERTFWRLLATMGLSLGQWAGGELDQVVQSIEQQLALSAATGNDLMHAVASLQLAYVQRFQGKLRLAAQTCWRLLAPIADRVGAPSAVAGWAAAWLSEISYEWNDLDAAVRFARDGLAQGQRIGNVEQQAMSDAALAQALQAQGDSAGAGVAMDQAAQLAQALPQPFDRALAASAQVRLWLAQGEFASAAAWAQACTPFAEGKMYYVRVFEQLTLARVAVVEGGARAAQAVPLLEALLYEAEAKGWLGQAIEAQALLALAYAAAGDSTRARDCLSHALTLTAPEGYIRLFADLGAPMHMLIADYRLQIAQRSHDESIARTGNLLAYIDKLLAAFGEGLETRGLRLADAGQASNLKSTASTLVEPLSARELEVLRLAAAGESNQAIAQTLIIAESTVKMHLKNIYGKLDVHSRTQAIARARALGLL